MIIVASRYGNVLWGLANWYHCVYLMMKKITFVGEQSPAGNLYAIDLDGGDILWKFAAEKVVGVEPDKRSYPSIVHICIDKDDNVYANAYRFVTAKDGGRGYNGKAVAFNKNGEQLWQFPRE